jgi:hypothetical protein
VEISTISSHSIPMEQTSGVSCVPQLVSELLVCGIIIIAARPPLLAAFYSVRRTANEHGLWRIRTCGVTWVRSVSLRWLGTMEY